MNHILSLYVLVPLLLYSLFVEAGAEGEDVTSQFGEGSDPVDVFVDVPGGTFGVIELSDEAKQFIEQLDQTPREDPGSFPTFEKPPLDEAPEMAIFFDLPAPIREEACTSSVEGVTPKTCELRQEILDIIYARKKVVFDWDCVIRIIDTLEDVYDVNAGLYSALKKLKNNVKTVKKVTGGLRPAPYIGGAAGKVYDGTKKLLPIVEKAVKISGFIDGFLKPMDTLDGIIDILIVATDIVAQMADDAQQAVGNAQNIMLNSCPGTLRILEAISAEVLPQIPSGLESALLDTAEIGVALCDVLLPIEIWFREIGFKSWAHFIGDVLEWFDRFMGFINPLDDMLNKKFDFGFDSYSLGQMLDDVGWFLDLVEGLVKDFIKSVVKKLGINLNFFDFNFQIDFGDFFDVPIRMNLGLPDYGFILSRLSLLQDVKIPEINLPDLGGIIGPCLNSQGATYKIEFTDSSINTKNDLAMGLEVDVQRISTFSKSGSQITAVIESNQFYLVEIAAEAAIEAYFGTNIPSSDFPQTADEPRIYFSGYLQQFPPQEDNEPEDIFPQGSGTQAEGLTLLSATLINVKTYPATVPTQIEYPCHQIPEQVDFFPMDSCDPSITMTKTDNLYFSRGCQTRTFTRRWHSDNDCHPQSTTQLVTINDSEPPVFDTFPDDKTVTFLARYGPNVLGTPTVYDVCDSTAIKIEFTDAIVETEALCGIHRVVERNWVITDACGNADNRIQTITILNEEFPFKFFVLDSLMSNEGGVLPLNMRCCEELPDERRCPSDSFDLTMTELDQSSTTPDYVFSTEFVCPQFRVDQEPIIDMLSDPGSDGGECSNMFTNYAIAAGVHLQYFQPDDPLPQYPPVAEVTYPRPDLVTFDNSQNDVRVQSAKFVTIGGINLALEDLRQTSFCSNYNPTSHYSWFSANDKRVFNDICNPISQNKQTIGTASLTGTHLQLSGTDFVYNVFNIDSTTLASAESIVLATPPDSVVIVNVAGDQLIWNAERVQMTISSGEEHPVLVWNVYEATTIVISGEAAMSSIFGSVMAPEAVVEVATPPARGGSCRMITLEPLPSYNEYECDAIPEQPVLTAYQWIAKPDYIPEVSTEDENVYPKGCKTRSFDRIWRTTDNCGNDYEHRQSIDVYDNHAPFFTTFPSHKTFNFLDPFGSDVAGIPTARDTCNSTDIHTSYVDTIDDNTENHPFCYSRTRVLREWTIEDRCLNFIRRTQVIDIIYDPTKLLGDPQAPYGLLEQQSDVSCEQCRDHIIFMEMRYLGQIEVDLLFSDDIGLSFEVLSVQPQQVVEVVGPHTPHDKLLSNNFVITVNNNHSETILTNCGQLDGIGHIYGDFLWVNGCTEHGPLCLSQGVSDEFSANTGSAAPLGNEPGDGGPFGASQGEDEGDGEDNDPFGASQAGTFGTEGEVEGGTFGNEGENVGTFGASEGDTFGTASEGVGPFDASQGATFANEGEGEGVGTFGNGNGNNNDAAFGNGNGNDNDGAFDASEGATFGNENDGDTFGNGNGNGGATFGNGNENENDGPFDASQGAYYDAGSGCDRFEHLVFGGSSLCALAQEAVNSPQHELFIQRSDFMADISLSNIDLAEQNLVSNCPCVEEFDCPVCSILESDDSALGSVVYNEQEKTLSFVGINLVYNVFLIEIAWLEQTLASLTIDVPVNSFNLINVRGGGGDSSSNYRLHWPILVDDFVIVDGYARPKDIVWNFYELIEAYLVWTDKAEDHFHGTVLAPRATFHINKEYSAVTETECRDLIFLSPDLGDTLDVWCKAIPPMPTAVPFNPMWLLEPNYATESSDGHADVKQQGCFKGFYERSWSSTDFCVDGPSVIQRTNSS